MTIYKNSEACICMFKKKSQNKITTAGSLLKVILGAFFLFKTERSHIFHNQAPARHRKTWCCGVAEEEKKRNKERKQILKAFE